MCHAYVCHAFVHVRACMHAHVQACTYACARVFLRTRFCVKFIDARFYSGVEEAVLAICVANAAAELKGLNSRQFKGNYLRAWDGAA